MKSLELSQYLTLAELLQVIEETRARYAALKKIEAVPDRTIRFYAEQGLLPNVVRGRGKKYPSDFVWKVLFIRLLTQRHQLKLAHVASAMRKVDVETMRRVVTGEEPLEFASPTDSVAAARHAARGHRVVDLESAPVDTGASCGKESDGWTTLVDQAHVVVRVRAGLSTAKRGQLRQIARLIESIVEETEVAGRGRL